MSLPPKPPKVMSTGLMNMKFMQRAAATASESLPDRSSPKRQKLYQETTASTPVSPSSGDKAIRALPDAEKMWSGEDLGENAEENVETEWCLSIQENGKGRGGTGMRVVQTGFSYIDKGSERGVKSGGVGRRVFGMSKSRDAEQVRNNDDESSSSSSNALEASDSKTENDGEVGPEDAEELLRAAKGKAVQRVKAKRKAKKKAARAEAARLADKRKRKEVKLNNLTSISAGGGDLKSRSSGVAARLRKSCSVGNGHEIES